jgi:hypothetical protein
VGLARPRALIGATGLADGSKLLGRVGSGRLFGFRRPPRSPIPFPSSSANGSVGESEFPSVRPPQFAIVLQWLRHQVSQSRIDEHTGHERDSRDPTRLLPPIQAVEFERWVGVPRRSTLRLAMCWEDVHRVFRTGHSSYDEIYRRSLNSVKYDGKAFFRALMRGTWYVDQPRLRRCSTLAWSLMSILRT